jgi:hypothetical protein
MVRRGKSGYHLVARSPGVTESEASALAAWSPSHGGLIVDAANTASVNFFPLPSGRFALSRTREGGAEYSGRGARQLYTHAVIVDAATLRQSGRQPFSLYRDALALGHFVYRPDPPLVLEPVQLSTLYPRRNGDAFSSLMREIGMPLIESIVSQLDAGQSVVFPYGGDRAGLAEFLVGRLPIDSMMRTSFATSLHPSAVRPYRLNLIASA